MDSQTTDRFWKSFALLPEEIQQKARQTYTLWASNPNHTSLHFKKIHTTDPIYSIRIGLHYRALGVKEENTMIWFWIGTHESYNNLIAAL